jgi:hypothetical protein
VSYDRWTAPSIILIPDNRTTHVLQMNPYMYEMTENRSSTRYFVLASLDDKGVTVIFVRSRPLRPIGASMIPSGMPG